MVGIFKAVICAIIIYLCYINFGKIVEIGNSVIGKAYSTFVVETGFIK